MANELKSASGNGLQITVSWEERNRSDFGFDALVREFDRLVQPNAPKESAALPTKTPIEDGN